MTTLLLTEAERIVLTGVLLKQIERYDADLDDTASLMSAGVRDWITGVRDNLISVKKKLDPKD